MISAAPAAAGPPPPFVYAPPREPLRVIHVDSSIIVLDKPEGLLAVPGKTPDLADCLASRAAARWADARTVHRLDLATSGLCVLARGAAAHRILSMQFARRDTAKTYEARVRGRVWADSGAIDLPLGTDWERRPRQGVDPVNGRPSQTRFAVLERSAAETRLRLEPLTGRSHQLRVHLLTLGHPILGDPIYGGGADEAPRMMLHATALAFRHPADGRPVRYESACPF